VSIHLKLIGRTNGERNARGRREVQGGLGAKNSGCASQGEEINSVSLLQESGEGRRKGPRGEGHAENPLGVLCRFTVKKRLTEGRGIGLLALEGRRKENHEGRRGGGTCAGNDSTYEKPGHRSGHRKKQTALTIVPVTLKKK